MLSKIQHWRKGRKERRREKGREGRKEGKSTYLVSDERESK
jgi:hypothetical protein